MYSKLVRIYKSIALIFLNTIILFVILNLVFLVAFKIGDLIAVRQTSNPVSEKYGNSVLREVYPDLSGREVNKLLAETWSRPYVFEPFTQFRERPYKGDYVNVDVNGFRLTKDQGPWPPEPSNFNVFLFGGSTTFGYGVPDNQTIASYLQELLAERLGRDVHVYNFGRGHYYSTQERILLENLLLSAFIPDMALFIDGLNDFYYYNGEPRYTKRLAKFIDNKARVESKFLKNLPVTRVVRSLKKKMTRSLESDNDSPLEIRFYENIYNNQAILARVVDRYVKNKKLTEAIADAYGIQPIFVWQPVPTYKYDLKYHLVGTRGFEEHSYSRFGYEYMAERINKDPLGDNFLWCADMQKDLKIPLYVDGVHYSAKMSQMLAAFIVSLIFERNLLSTKT